MKFVIMKKPEKFFEIDGQGLKDWWEKQHAKPQEDDPTGMIIGIVVGVVVLIIVIVVIVAARKNTKSSSKHEYRYPQHGPPPYAVAQGHIHTGHQTMPQIQIRDGQLGLAVANCYI